MVVTLSGFRTRFPEFADAIGAGNRRTDAQITLALDEGRIIHAVTDLGTLYAAAHLLVLDDEETGQVDGGSGLVKSEKLGPQEVDFQTQALTAREVFYATTSYGRKLLALEARIPRLVVTARAVG